MTMTKPRNRSTESSRCATFWSFDAPSETIFAALPNAPPALAMAQKNIKIPLRFCGKENPMGRTVELLQHLFDDRIHVDLSRVEHRQAFEIGVSKQERKFGPGQHRAFDSLFVAH